MKYLFTALYLLIAFAAFADEENAASLSGTVTTSDGQPAQYVSLYLKELDRSTLSGENGQFIFRGVRVGTYTLIASAVGIERKEMTITIEEGPNKANIVLDISLSRLQEVIVIAERNNRFNVKKSETVARLPLLNLENPQSYTTITQQLLKEQLITSFNDALKNASGLDKLWTSTGRGGDGAGYFSLRGFATQPALVDGIAGLTNGDLDPSNIEKIEVIKGPSGTLFGGAITNFGGLINILTKKPVADTLGGEISYTAGSYGLNRIAADVYAPLNKERTFLARVNTAYHDQNSFQDAGFRRSFFVAPSFRYQVSERLSLGLGAEFYTYQGTNPLMVFLNRGRQLIARTPDQLNFNFNKSYTANDVTVKTPATNIHGQVNYRISDQWTAQTNFSRSFRKSDGYYQYVMYIGASDTLLNRYAALQNSSSTSANVQQNFTGDFLIGGLRNRLVVGLDYLNLQTNNDNSPYILFDQVNSSRNDPRYLGFSRAALDARVGASTAAPTRNSVSNSVYSAYASNVLNITEQLLAMLSLRVDRFVNHGTYNRITALKTGKYEQTAYSPKFGLVYQPVPNKLAFFANYMNGFRNVAPVTQPLPDISGTFKPQQANQFEGGVKVDAFSDKLSLTASYYHITVENMTRSESVVRGGNTYLITVQDGTQESKGFEFDLIANPAPGLNLVAGFSHNDSKMTKADPSVNGRRPVSAGPENLVNAWISYAFQSGKVKGLGLGFGGNYASENVITNSLATGIFTLPAYTVLNATAYYNTPKYRIGLKLDNLTNEQYYKGWTTVEVQMPRTFSANFTLKF